MTDKPYASIVATWEDCLRRHGDSAPGVGWPRNDAELRYRIMLDLLRSTSEVTLLDFGCGASHFYEFIRRLGLSGIRYSGLDVSPSFLELSRRKFPEVAYYQVDLLDDEASVPIFDYVVMNGIFTYRARLSDDEMFTYMCRLLRRVTSRTRVGLAFNAMSTQVDSERADLFHLSLDRVLGFLTREISRHVVVRHDYSLYEFTVHVYLEPTIGAATAKRLVDGAATA
jgi:SAM-dependent methyltransferase